MSDDGDDLARSVNVTSSAISASSNGGDEDASPDDITRRRCKNRVNAQRSRERKRLMLDTLQQEHWQLHQENKKIKGENEKIREAIRSIRSLLSSGALPLNSGNAGDGNNAFQQPNHGNLSNAMGNGDQSGNGNYSCASQASHPDTASSTRTGNPLFDLLANQLLVSQSQPQPQKWQEQQQPQHHQQQQVDFAGAPLLTQLLLANLLQQQGGGGLLNPLLSGLLRQQHQQGNPVAQDGTISSQGTRQDAQTCLPGEQQHNHSSSNSGSDQNGASMASVSNTTNQAMHPGQFNKADSSQATTASTLNGGIYTPALLNFLQQVGATASNSGGRNEGSNQNGGLNNGQVAQQSHFSSDEQNHGAVAPSENGNGVNPALLAFLQQAMMQQSGTSATNNEGHGQGNIHDISSAPTGFDREGSSS